MKAFTTLGATLVDLNPPEAPGRAGLVNGVAPISGLALGAVGCGALVQLAPFPTHLVFAVLLVGAAIAGVVVALMPETAAMLGVSDPFDPHENIEGGVRHLCSLMDRFNGNLPLVLAAYNAGERAVLSHGGIPPYRETRQYVNRILRKLAGGEAKTSERSQRGPKV